MKTIALNSFGIEASRNRQQLGDTRHGLVKRRVEAGHLRQFRVPLAERLNQFNLARQMLRVVRADAMQFGQQFPGDNFRLGMFHPVNHAMSHAFDRFEINLPFKPVDQEVRGRFVISGGKFEALRLFLRRFGERQIRPAQADAINLSIKLSLQWFANLVERELDARRAAVDGQDF